VAIWRCPLARQGSPGGGSAGAEITVARSLAELQPLRPAWNDLQGRELNTYPDFFETVYRVRPQVVRPHAVLLERNGRPRALALGRIEDTKLPVKLGYHELWAPNLRTLTVIYGGVLGDVGEVEARLLCTELKAAVGNGEADALRLRNLPVGSPMHRVARSMPSLLTWHPSTPSVHWELELPGSLDELLRSRKKSVRENFRSARNRLDREYGDRLSIRIFRDPSEMDEMFEQVDAISARTYQGGHGVAFTGDPLQRGLTALSMERDWFRAYVLSIDSTPVAFWHGSAYRGRFHLGIPGYDPAYRHLGVGSYLLLRLIGDLCEDERIESLDFGFGDADYKRRLADRRWEEEDVLYFAPTPKAIGINLSRTALLTTAGVAQRGLQRSGSLARVKRRWRERLAWPPAGIVASVQAP